MHDYVYKVFSNFSQEHFQELFFPRISYTGTNLLPAGVRSLSTSVSKGFLF